MCCGYQKGGVMEETETLLSPKELMKLKNSMRASIDKIVDSNTSLVAFNIAGGVYHQDSS